ncbi:hypothetical protein AMK59_8281 [Oryctes borbonicus]|uniref:Lipocalin/cytosolic fatty-acid binding domain-containing protein n=1 Tax=Oryctes borbonicus TaxID=1629725 RepID=A0A0T6AWB3_9SCAR|nr:hypothetical protein AMK59_8281 [Oryctes borbonicus]
MMKSLLILVLASVVYCQVPFLGPCPELETLKDFDAVKYMGKWYEAERYFALFEFGGKCVTADLIPTKEGKINIVNQQTSSITGIRSTIEGNAFMLGRNDESKLTVNFPSLPVNFDAPYWILDTDYDNYAVVWSCNKFGIFSTSRLNR